MVKMGNVWDRAVEFLGDNIATLLPVVVLAVFVPMSIWNSLGVLWPTADQGLKLALVIGFLALGLTILWGYLAITALAIDPAPGGRATAIAVQRLLPAIGIYLLLFVGAMALMLPFGILLGLGGVDMAAMQTGRSVQMPPGYGLALFAYLLVFLIVSLAVGARLAPLGGVVLTERRGVGAIVRAFRLTRGLTWKLVGVTILYVVTSQVAALAARTVFGSVLAWFDGGDGPLTVAGAVTGVVVAAVQTGFTVLAAAFCAKLYVAIRHEPAAAPPIDDPIAA